MGKFIPISILLLLMFVLKQYSHAVRIDADADGRYSHLESEGHDIELKRTGVTLSEVISDDKGDRIIFFLRGEGESNFSELLIEQIYSQYKGPMGKWNVAVGRFMLPFGLLANYDSERLLIETLEDDTLNITHDSGIKLFGIINNFEYAFSASQGIGVKRWNDNNSNKLVAARTGVTGDDFEDFSVGLSGVLGSVFADNNSLYKRLLAVDFTKYIDLFVFRGEFVWGTENCKEVAGLFMGVDYRILPAIDINTSFKLFDNYKLSTSAILGLSYYTSFLGLIIRAAHKFPIKGGRNESYIQVYNSHTFNFFH